MGFIKYLINKYKRKTSDRYSMSVSERFYKVTGLNISDFKKGVNPEDFKRKTLNSRNIIESFENNNITKDDIKRIYSIYSDEIVSEYIDDTELKNKSTIATGGSYDIMFAPGGLQDHVTHYSISDFKKIYEKYLNDEELSQKEKYILMGLLIKTSDLLEVYGINYLKEHSNYIKSEIKMGVFRDIVLNGKKYLNSERKKIASLSKVWNIDKWSKYKNLPLLKKRIRDLSQDDKTSAIIQKIDIILSKSISELKSQAGEITSFLNSIYLEYEIQNRKQILEKVYSPEKKKRIIIQDASELSCGAMLHFFDSERTISNFNSYVMDLEKRRSEELGKEFRFSDDEKKALYIQYQTKENRFITDYVMDFVGIGQIENYGEKYLTNTSNQLSTMFCTAKEILDGTFLRSRVALGFSKSTVNPELIAITSTKSIHSNKGIEYIETNNQFKDFSSSYRELMSVGNSYDGNTEIVLFRNSCECSLKPSYIMYVAKGKIDSKNEQERINLIESQMKAAGLDLPIVIFDKYTILNKEKAAEERDDRNN